MEHHIANFANAEFETVIPLEAFALDPFPVDEGAVLAALIDNVVFPVFRHDESVVARDAGIGDHQILIHFAAHAERSTVENDVSLLVALHEHERGKYSRPGGLRTTYRI